LTGLLKRIVDTLGVDQDPRMWRRSRRGPTFKRSDVRPHGKTALVTGATGAWRCDRAGCTSRARRWLSGTRREVLDRLLSSWERVHVLPCNLSDKEVEALVPGRRHGELDILVLMPA
jgi:hypothetical protein